MNELIDQEKRRLQALFEPFNRGRLVDRRWLRAAQ